VEAADTQSAGVVETLPVVEILLVVETLSAGAGGLQAVVEQSLLAEVEDRRSPAAAGN
jgi:hypothetical protein